MTITITIDTYHQIIVNIVIVMIALMTIPPHPPTIIQNLVFVSSY